ncbi:hypothetical protein [Methylomonas sp. AM2-LC]|uniref:hypothetical protein n=1 Tax=Methylomonas sp. AM2-LC TaxID=3153301 RepID=UPI003262FDFE
MYDKTPMQMVNELNSAGYKDAAELIKLLCRQSSQLVKQRDVLLRLLEKNT